MQCQHSGFAFILLTFPHKPQLSYFFKIRDREEREMDKHKKVSSLTFLRTLGTKVFAQCTCKLGCRPSTRFLSFFPFFNVKKKRSFLFEIGQCFAIIRVFNFLATQLLKVGISKTAVRTMFLSCVHPT